MTQRMLTVEKELRREERMLVTIFIVIGLVGILAVSIGREHSLQRQLQAEFPGVTTPVLKEPRTEGPKLARMR